MKAPQGPLRFLLCIFAVLQICQNVNSAFTSESPIDFTMNVVTSNALTLDVDTKWFFGYETIYGNDWNEDTPDIHSEYYGIQAKSNLTIAFHWNLFGFFTRDVYLQINLFKLVPLKVTVDYTRLDRNLVNLANGDGFSLVHTLKFDYELRLLWVDTTVVENLKTYNYSFIQQIFTDWTVLIDPATWLTGTLDFDSNYQSTFPLLEWTIDSIL